MIGSVSHASCDLGYQLALVYARMREAILKHMNVSKMGQAFSCEAVGRLVSMESVQTYMFTIGWGGGILLRVAVRAAWIMPIK